MSVVTAALAKRYLQVAHASDDTLIQLLLDGAEEWLAKRLAFAWTEATHTDYVDGGGVSLWPFAHPIISITSVYDTVTTTTAASTTYLLKRNMQVFQVGGLRWLGGRGRWRVIYEGGYGGDGASSIAVPSQLKTIVLMLVARAYNNRGGMSAQNAEGFGVTWQEFVSSDIVRLMGEYDWTMGIR